ncbi:MAG TPA: serine hydrolase, partial [Chitinophagales bacterium]|nr:serine hydrolase [Chitinophagales bacterium]
GKVNGKEVMPFATMLEMMTDKIANIKLRTDDEFGYGLFINNLGSDKDNLIGKNIGHGGDSRVYHSIVVAFPKLHLGFVLLTNSAGGGSFTKSAVLQIAREYIRDVKGIPLQRGTKSAFSLAAGEVDQLDNALIAGTYGSGGADFVTILEKNERKLIFRQDRNKLVLKNDGSGIYSVKYLLLKFIPVKVKAASFGFRSVDGNVYMKTLDNKSKDAEYISVKDRGVAMTKSWEAAAGRYRVVNLCPGNMLLYPDEVKMNGNKILVHRIDPMKEEEDDVSFNMISDSLAISDGIDRGAGSTLEILPNGNLYWSGYEMGKVK